MDDSCIQVSIYDDRVEVYSPGMLYGGLDLEEALRGKSKCRNAAISEAFHYMKIIEAWGTGLGRIRNSCREYGLKEPVIEESGNGFRVVFYRKMVNADQNIINEDTMVISIDQKMCNENQNVSNESQKAGNEFTKYEGMLKAAGITNIFIMNIKVVYHLNGQNVFKQSDVMKYLNCSKSKAGNVINAMKRAEIISKVKGMGPGRYRFI